MEKIKNKLKFLYLFIYILINYCVNAVKIETELITPQIELVEYVGCQHTEFRLTCPDIDSTIAILEAKFIPDCDNTTTNSTNNCAQIDLTRLITSSKLAAHLVDTRDAGRKFLETLRKSDLYDDDYDNDYDYHVDNGRETHRRTISSTTTESESITSSSNHDPRYKRTSIKKFKLSLEELIELFLQELQSDSMRRRPRNVGHHDSNEATIKYRGDVTDDISNLNNNYDFGDEDDDDGDEDNNVQKVFDKIKKRIEIGAKNITILTSDNSENSHDDDNNISELFSGKNFPNEPQMECPIEFQRSKNLNRLDFDKAMINDSDYEFNIRNFLNYRCSGKNHCSFIFNIDHPFSVLWNSGTVKIKYICMEPFRLNKYCGERLTIGPEMEFNYERLIRHKRKHVGEPVAEARTQPDPALHLVKILKSDEPVETGTISNQIKRRKNQKIYSKDFRAIKIIPNNLDDINDIENVGDEIFIKKDVKESINIDNEMDKNVIEYDDKKETSTLINILRTTPGTINKVETTITASTPTVTSTPSPKFSKIHEQHKDENLIFSEENENDIIDENNIRIVRSTEGYEILIREGDEIRTTFGFTTISPYGPDNQQRKTVSPIELNKENSVWEDEIKREYPNIYDSEEITRTTDSDNVIDNDFDDTDDDDDDDDDNDDKDKKIDEIIARNNLVNNFYNNNNNNKQINSSQINNNINNDNEFSNKIENTLDNLAINRQNKYDGKSDDMNISPKPMVNKDFDQEFTDKSVISNISEEDNDDDDDDDNDDDDDDDDYYDEDDDYQIIYNDGITLIRRNKNRIHTSHQIVVKYRQPLEQGFIASPGYPKYYIGDSECKWFITAPKNQKVLLTILDLNMRYDPVCKDYIEVMDMEKNQTIFYGCNDYSKPFQIVSHSNRLQIMMKTTSKVAYPKRGVLLHYTVNATTSTPIFNTTQHIISQQSAHSSSNHSNSNNSPSWPFNKYFIIFYLCAFTNFINMIN